MLVTSLRFCYTAIYCVNDCVMHCMCESSTDELRMYRVLLFLQPLACRDAYTHTRMRLLNDQYTAVLDVRQSLVQPLNSFHAKCLNVVILRDVLHVVPTSLFPWGGGGGGGGGGVIT